VKKVTFLFVFVMACFLGAASAQQVDAAFGFNAVHAKSGANADTDYSPQSVGGGLTPSFSADFLLPRHFGVGAEFSWRASKSIYEPALIGVPYRPFFYDFNAIWAPPITKRVSAELMAGIGAENTRFYVAPSCGINCQNYATTNHFLGHFGAGLRLYPVGNFFVRPEAHVYLVHNNNQFSSPYATRYGVSIGYSFGRR
jgi:hypothetical protein